MKKLLSIVLASLMIITSICIVPISAVDNPTSYEASQSMSFGNPLSVRVETDKKSGGSLDVAKVTVTITNNSEKRVNEISSMSSFNDIKPVKKDSILFIDSVSIAPKSSYSYSFSVTVNPNKLNFIVRFILLIKTFFIGSRNVPGKNFNNGREVISSDIYLKLGNVKVSDKVSVLYEKNEEVIKPNAEIITPKTNEEYYKEISKLTNETLEKEGFDVEKALSDDYYSARLVVKADDLNSYDFSEIGASKVIKKDNEAVLQFDDANKAKDCERNLKNKSGLDVLPDGFCRIQSMDNDMQIIAKPAEGSMSWGEGYIKADAYSKYLENNSYYDLIKVAVIDSGIDLDHPYLKGRILSNGYDFVNFKVKPDDVLGHGTHVAGIIADCTNDLNVKIMPIKVIGDNELGGSLVIAKGIEYAIDGGADVINLSLGGKNSELIDNAVEKAVDKGVVVCVSSGNGDEVYHNPIDTANVSPAGVEKAIVVSAIDSEGKIAPFSNYGASVDIAAPGVKITSAYKDGNYAIMSGTSMAAPYVSAAAAMIKLANPDYTPAQIEETLKNYCDDLGDEGRDDYYGNGALNLYHAIPDCTVSFNVNGGSSVESKTTKSGFDIDLPVPTKSFKVTLNANGGSISNSVYNLACAFDGWYKEPLLDGLRCAGGNAYVVKSNETLYAKWNNPMLGAVNSPSRTNYNFLGWYTSANGGSKYTSASQIDKDITLYAHWELKTVTMPNVVGQSYWNAKATLEGMGINVSLNSDYNSNYAKDVVYNQSVAANSKIAVGSWVTLTYSKGAKPISVGDYVTFNGNAYLYRTIAGGPKNGVYKKDASDGTITGSYVYNGVTYFQFMYAGASTPFGWAPNWCFSQH